MPYNDREVRQGYADATAELAKLKGSKSPGAAARRADAEKRKRAWEQEWREIIARKRRGEITDTYALDVVKRIAEPIIKLSGLGLEFGRQEIMPRDGSHISDRYALLAMRLTEVVESDSDFSLTDLSDEDFEAMMSLPESEDEQAERLADEKLERNLVRLGIAITTEILETERAVLRPIHKPSHYNEAVEATEYFTITTASRTVGSRTFSGPAILWLVNMEPWHDTPDEPFEDPLEPF